ncbi:hypothetical protein LUZ60_006690 [Juncus effusus]|nr:hypothetical protein LUZ60_006690 [Juncus effusus]
MGPYLTASNYHRLLPFDCPLILARAVEPVRYRSAKELFFRLCNDPVLIDGGKMSFGLERSTGAKCFMISASALGVWWGHDRRYWKWIPISESRFSEAAELLDVCWLEIRGYMPSNILSPRTTYTAHLIFKLTERTYGLQNPPQEVSINIGGQTVSTNLLTLPTNNRVWRWPCNDGVRPNVRGDGWREAEMGEFRCENGEEGEVMMRLMGKGGHWKSGLIIQGIEIRPKI